MFIHSHPFAMERRTLLASFSPTGQDARRLTVTRDIKTWTIGCERRMMPITNDTSLGIFGIVRVDRIAGTEKKRLRFSEYLLIRAHLNNANRHA
jgi:hypothetical protein